jgi:hypothetical protein
MKNRWLVIVSEATVCEKARHPYSDITKDTPGAKESDASMG